MHAHQGLEAEVRELVERGADPNLEAAEFDDTKEADDKKKRTPLMAASESHMLSRPLMKMAPTSGFKMCFAPMGAGAKCVSNPV